VNPHGLNNPDLSVDWRALMSRLSLAIIAVLAGLGPAEAQHAPASPYAGWEHRPVKALSKEQIADLRAGRGMGLALPAELNGYPGPVHVLELGGQLRLTTEQRIRVQELHAAMKAEAIPLSERLMTQEADLDCQFATQSLRLRSCKRPRWNRPHARRPAARPPALPPLDAGRPHTRAGQAVRRASWLPGIGGSRHGSKGHH
jgi:hypothetical protein